MVKLPSTAREVRIALLVGLAVLFLWVTLQVDFVIFAGILLAIFLDGLTRLAMRHARLSHGRALLAVVVLIACVVAGLAYLFAADMISQIDQLTIQLGTAADQLQKQVAHLPWGKALLAGSNLRQMMSVDTIGRLLGVASNGLAVIGGIAIVAFFGIYIAAEPDLYVRGLMALCPWHLHGRVTQVLAEAAGMIWYWSLGRLFSMAVVGICTTIGLWLIGMPLPLALGGLAGVMTFVPYLGAIVSAVPALIIALATNMNQAIGVAVLYLAVHIVEGYILVPLVQRKAGRVPPAMTLASQLLLGTVGGLLGVTFATPLAAALIPIVRDVYVEDTLGNGDELAG